MTKDMPHVWDDIDPTVFIDDDGQAYMFWGNGSCKWVKLKKNMRGKIFANSSRCKERMSWKF